MTLPNLWTDTMTYLNQFLSWDIVKGFLTATLGIGLLSYVVAKIGSALSH